MVYLAWLLLVFTASAQQTPPSEAPSGDGSGAPAVEAPAPTSSPSNARTDLNLLGQTDTGKGESRRNENVQFNLIDNNAQKELNIRLGTTATLVQEFNPERSLFGYEFGASPSAD